MIKWCIAAVSMLFLCGCSHNVGMAINGKFINLGYDPETNKVGIQYYDGVIVTGMARENSEAELVYETTTGGENGVSAKGSTTSKMVYTNKIGHQVTGYLVDAVEAGATVGELQSYVEGK